MTDEPIRLRATFEKRDEMRYTGHLDLHRTWERTLRRAGLPLAYSQGFNPRPRINLGSALPLGFTSQAEVVDFWLEESRSVDEVARAIHGAQPPGLLLRSIIVVDPKAASLQSELRSAEYQVTLLERLEDLDAKLRTLLERESIPRRRRNKDYDLRPLIEGIRRLADDEDGCARFELRLAARDGATGRPEEVVAELGLPPELARVHRTNLIFQDAEIPEAQ